MAYSGTYKPVNPKKYRGNPNQVIYRSLWERKLMVYCDNNDAVLEWGSEEVIIPYLSPWDGKLHRYFPDFYMKVNQANGTIKKFIIEVKPKAQFKPPFSFSFGILDRWFALSFWFDLNNELFD